MTHYGFSIDIKRSTHLERIKFNKTKMMDVVAYNHQRNFHSDMQLPIYRIHICVDDGQQARAQSLFIILEESTTTTTSTSTTTTFSQMF